MPLCQTCPHYVKPICDRPSTGGGRARLCGPQVEAPPADRTFSALFERHQRHVVAWACRITGSYELAKDIAQDVFIKALTGIDGFRRDARFTTWLYTITRNCCHDYSKARAARPREVDDRVLLTAPPVVENDAIAALEAQYTARLVRRLMRDARLDAIDARAFTLHYRDDVPLEAVTERLGLTNRSGARARIVSAKRKLRRCAARWRRLEQGNPVSRNMIYANPSR